MSNPSEKAIGKPVNRIESIAKVTGSARYAADYHFNNLAYGVMITSTIARGRIIEIDSRTAERRSGVLTVMSHLNAPEVPGYGNTGRGFKPFRDDKVYFNLQPVALVIATTLEEAKYAASLVNIRYEKADHHTSLDEQIQHAVVPDNPADYTRGNAQAWESAAVKIEQEYETSYQVHNPIEPHATTAYWENDDKLHIFNKSQAVKLTRQQFAAYFNLKEENIKVHAPFVGGAFGSASKVLPQEMAAVLGAKKTGRPVQVALQREQVFNMVGYRPHSRQKFAIGANTDGSLVGIRHQAWGVTSRHDQFTERILEPTKSLYNCDNLETTYKLVHLDMSTPGPARGPGETSGSFAMESAMDELAYALKMDPLELRLKNFATTDLLNNKPWSSNHLKECYLTGAKAFGWEKRHAQPGSMKKDGMLSGMGMSAGIYKSQRVPASASVTISDNGQAMVRCSVADTGPGSITVLTQIAADALGIPVDKVEIEWANSDLPEASPQYGSHTTASTGSAVHEAALALKQKFIQLLHTDTTIDYTAILKQHNLPELEATVNSKPSPGNAQYSGKSFAAHFVEVLVHPLTGQVRVSRVVSVIDAGKIMNHKTGRSQVLGSVVWGIGIALMEEGIIDHRYGRYINNNLADYHLPVAADMPEIDVHFIDKADPVIDPMGAKGLGEIGLIGFTAAIANAVYHATGKRIRKLPITPDKLCTL